MMVYTVTSETSAYYTDYNALRGTGIDRSGGRLKAKFHSSTVWLPEGSKAAVDFQTLPHGVGATGLLTCNAVLYLYYDQADLAGVVAFHSPSGTMEPTHRSTGMKGPVAEAKGYGIHVNNKSNIRVVLAAGPHTASGYGTAPTHKSIKDDLFKAAFNLLREEGIEGKQVAVYLSSDGEFGINELGHLGERGSPPQQPSAVQTDTNIKMKKKSCYITTAACETLGLGDDCAELTRLRWFRDVVMLGDPEGRREVEEYYATAPRIVTGIDARPDRRAIYERIYWHHLRPAVAAIEEGDFARARAIYQDLVRRLQASNG